LGTSVNVLNLLVVNTRRKKSSLAKYR